jgi:Mitochondrial carrier protein
MSRRGAGSEAGESVVGDLLAGFAGGLAATIVGHPLDTIKTRMAVYLAEDAAESAASTSGSVTSKPVVMSSRANSLFQDGRVPVRSGRVGGVTFVEAVRAGPVYNGVSVPLLATVLAMGNTFASRNLARQLVTAVFFPADDPKKRSRRRVAEAEASGRLPGDPLPIRYEFLVGCLAGVPISVLTAAPAELLKIRMQVAEPLGTAPAHQTEMARLNSVCRTVVRNRGLLGFWQGLPSVLARFVPAYGVMFASYEATRARLGNSDVAIAVSGGVGGVGFWGLFYPLEVVKTRMQADMTGRYKSMRHCIAKTWAAEGVPGFFHGYVPAYVIIICSPLTMSFSTNSSLTV